MQDIRLSTFICLLRGINVSGTNLIRMEELRAGLSSLGLEKVTTYIQSGNIIFQSEEASKFEVEKQVQNLIRNKFNLEIPVMVKSISDWTLSIKNNPFLASDSLPIEYLHLTLLDPLPDKDLIIKLSDLNDGIDQGQIIEDRIYLYCPNGYGRTKFTNTFFEKKLKVKATTRNWKTVLKLAEMAENL